MTFDVAEIEAEFRRFWRTGMIREDWNAWVDLFTEDVDYHERVLGSMKGRESVRAWILPLMERYGEIYGVYAWHHVDPSGRVVFYMQNRRDRPDGNGFIDFPGVTVLQYAGGGRWSMEEDYWAEKLGIAAFQEYEALRKAHDPGHRDKRTRQHWGEGPTWTQGGCSWAERPSS